MNTKKYKRLSFQERVIIQTHLEEKRSKSIIANRLNPSRFSISREINKWINVPEDKYETSIADWYAKVDNLNKINLLVKLNFEKL